MNEKNISEVDFTILGLGLMGGSLAAALHEKARSVSAVDPNPAALQFALQRGWIDRGETSLTPQLLACHCVVLAAPVRVNLTLINKIAPSLPEGCLLLDLSSTKSEIFQALQDLPAHIDPIGGHPMCGKESQGVDNADPLLFAGRVFFLTPLQRTPPAALRLALQIIAAIGARPLVADAGQHDSAVAAVSALPYLLSGALARTAHQVAQDNPLVWQAAASGYRDTSRLAASDTNMMLDVLLTNPDNVIHALRACLTDLQALAEELENGWEQALAQRLDQSKTIRRNYQE